MPCLVNQIHKAINYVVPDIHQGCGLRKKDKEPKIPNQGKHPMPVALKRQSTALYTHR